MRSKGGENPAYGVDDDVRLGTEGRHCTQKLHPEFAGDRERDCYC